jgi:hypothetical protein
MRGETESKVGRETWENQSKGTTCLTHASDLRCRLCDGTLRAVFSLKILKKYIVAYFECLNCKSLQTELPFWLEEAYKSNLTDLDIGAAQRNLRDCVATYFVAKSIRLQNAIDFGGGDGFLCRLLRDYGLNCFVYDKYTHATYAAAFTQPDFVQPDLLLAYEVAEHLINPRIEFERMFSVDPKVLIMTTGIYSGQGPRWWYLVPDTGQHVFFYSQEALQWIARAYRRRLLICGNYILYVKPECVGAVQVVWLRLLSSRGVLRLLRALFIFAKPKGLTLDDDRLKEPWVADRQHDCTGSNA